MKKILSILSLVLSALVIFPSAAFASTYVVKSGDTLSAIAPHNWQEVCRHNALANCNLIYPGQQLDIPEGGEAIAPVSRAVVTSSEDVPGVQTALNSPYVYGGNRPGGFDCSGLSQWISAQRGYSIPRTVAAQVSALPHIRWDQARAGDLLAFSTHHVGVLLGNGKVLQALNPSQGIRITTIDDGIKYNGFLAILSVH